MGAFGLIAAPLTPQEALARLGSQNLNAPRKVRGINKTGMKLVHTQKLKNGAAALYVFESAASDATLFLSADDLTAPILGYTDDNSFDSTNIPPQLEYWLGEYARQIEYASEHGVAQTRSVSDIGRHAIAPMCKTQWNQDAPYNNQCPKMGTRAMPTGCVATAMAQVMKYWNYPSNGTGTGICYVPAGADGVTSISLKRPAFDWDNMLNIYEKGKYDDTQANAVAWLMKACGYASQMDYNVGASGTLSRIAGQAMIHNFTYSDKLTYCERDYYTAEEWDNIVYRELETGRPILYGGLSSTAGHEFVCDGYAGNGYYHFNWGWGGMSNGFFLLAALDPGSVGIGGGSGSNGYNMDQDILIGIQPEDSTLPQYNYAPRISQLGIMDEPTVNGRQVSIKVTRNGQTGSWINTGITNFQKAIEFGLSLTPALGTTGNSVFVTLGTTNPAVATTERSPQGGYLVYWNGINAKATANIPANLPDGLYYCEMATRAPYGDTGVYPVLANLKDKHSFFLSSKGGTLSIATSVSPELVIENLDALTAVYYGNYAKFSVTVSNPTNREITQSLIPTISQSGNVILIGDEFEVTVPAGGSVVKEYATSFRVMNGQTAPTSTARLPFGFMDAKFMVPFSYSKTVRFAINNGASYNASFGVVGEEAKESNLSNGKTGMLYELASANDVKLEGEIENLGDYFGYGIVMQLTSLDNTAQPLVTTMMNPVTILTDYLEKGKFSGSFSFPNCEVSKQYIMQLYLMAAGGMKEMNADPKYVSFKASSVGDVEDEEGVIFDRVSRKFSICAEAASVEIYDVTGRKVASVENSSSISVPSSFAGIGVVVVRTAEGKVLSTKFCI